MPEITGRLRTPRLASAPVTPQAGEIYYDTTTNKLYWWNGTTWIDSTGGGGGVTSYVAKTALITGNDGGIGTAFGTLFSFGFTPAVNVQGIVQWQVLLTCVQPTWNWAATKLIVVGAGAVSLCNGAPSGLAWCHRDGVASAHWHGFDQVQLNAGVAYTFQIQAAANAVSTFAWSAQPVNYAVGEFWAR